MVPPCSDRISRVPPYSRIERSLRIRGYHPLRPDFPDRSACLRSTTGLFRVRSPLLAESLLMSVPPGTEMFQFPGFASMSLCIQPPIPHRGGLPHSDIHGSTPARGSPWLFAACHVLHRLLVPRHPPNALLMLENPPDTSRPEPPRRAASSRGSSGTRHAQEPSRPDRLRSIPTRHLPHSRSTKHTHGTEPATITSGRSMQNAPEHTTHRSWTAPNAVRVRSHDRRRARGRNQNLIHN